LKLHKDELFVLKRDVQDADVVTCIVQTRVKGTTGRVINLNVDFDGVVLAHFVDDYFGNIIIPVSTRDIQPISVDFRSAPLRQVS
jgi:hypothetical protein